ncbi:hypothetical protein C1T31_12500 [Hanstruepera neustonica]|uniref:Tail specific protease domain-containing protein n=1 Tax=Hanstruepera neustonica TaxID=1445657 RepID=A0A2K1DWG1_9FLAO|nr:carboxy terminal-processing peptidase [Hanstruepera neustonica]PNQ72360.1 hypothetical protein C1T31_12500 [Hanstruepera neustonica]
MIHHLRCLILLFFTITIWGQESNVFCKRLSAVLETVNQHHYKPKPVDDNFSIAVYHLFLDSIDDRQQFFTQEDINLFSQDSLQLDDFVKNNNCHFISKYTTTLETRINQSKSILESLKTVELDYSGKDTLYFDADRPSEYFKDETHQNSYWNKRVRYKILSSIIDEDSILSSAKTNFKALEKDIKPKIIQQQICVLEELLNQSGGIDRYVKEAFLNAFLNYQDPNSSFFNTSQKTQFETSVSNDQLSFGLFTAKNNNGEIEIVHIQPGSSAFKNGDLEVNDIIKSIHSNGETLETYCISNNDVVSFLNDSHHNTINLSVKKQNGVTKKVKLSKIKSEVETNNIVGYVIKKSDNNIGYIRIPSFYTDLETPNGLGVANDVAKELYKLQKESISGLILDLRFNSGGSMKEAADLSGMFINRGPLAISKYSNGESFTIKDSQRGSLFNKPLLILINGYSASASEFFTAAMQDYKRGVIVGSSSYGKATAQIILPIDEDPDYGFVKITVEKFYRSTGKSHQQFGIKPDIILPSVYDNLDFGEKNKKYALKNDSIKPTMSFMALKQTSLNDIAKKSYIRQKNDDNFNRIKTLNTDLLKNLVHKKKQYPLTLENVYQDFNEFKTIWDNFSNLKLKQSSLLISNTSSTNEIVSYNDDEKKLNEEHLSTLASDIYINEAQQIMNDIINLTNNQ